MPTNFDELQQAGGTPHRQHAQLPADRDPAPAPSEPVLAVLAVAQTDPAAAQAGSAPTQPDPAPAQTDPAVHADPATTQPDQVADASAFTKMSMAELMQLDLILNEGGDSQPGADTMQGHKVLPEDLTELSLLDLMSLKVTTEKAPDLPDLNPPDHDFRLHDENLDDSNLPHLSNINLIPAGTLPGTSPVPEQPPPSPPSQPPGTNVPPDAKNDSYSVAEDGTLKGSSVLANDTDGNGDHLTASLVTGPLHGTLSLSSAGTFTYHPVADYNGADSFTYKVSDGRGGVDTATVSITVNSVNDPPVAAADAATTSEDTPVVINVLANDSDLHGGAPGEDNTPLSSQIVGGGPAHGTLVLNPDGTYTYTPNADYNGTDSFTYQAVDSLGAVSNTATVIITVTSVNDPPVANDDSYSVAEDTTLTVKSSVGVLANDSDLHGGAPSENNLPLNAQLVTDVAHGTLTLLANGHFTYTPDADFNGTDSFTYQTVDKLGGVSNVATVTISVTSVNDPPVAVDDAATLPEDGVLAGTSVLANDSDLHGGAPSENNTPLTAQLGTGPAHGGLVFNSDGTYTYTPDADYNGTDSFTYKAVDSLGAASNTGTVTITVTSVNDPPVAADDAATVAEDNVLKGTSVLANDSDAHGGAPSENNTPLTAQLVGDVAHGSLTLNADGTYTYTPDADYNGTDSFTYQAVDSLGGVSNTGTVTITVTSVNDPPVATDDTATIAEDNVLNGASVLANDGDLHGGAPSENNTPLTAQLGAGPAHGGLVFNSDGTYTYTPDADYNGTDSFTYKAVDSLGAVSNTGTVTITVTSVNDPPVATDDAATVSEDNVLNGSSVLANDSDLHGGAPSENNTPLTAQLGAGPAHGGLVFNSDGTYTYTPDADFNGTDSFTYQAVDSLGGVSNTATVAITVASVNDAPAGADGTVTTDEDTAYVFSTKDFGFSDPNDSPANNLSAVRIDAIPLAGALLLSGAAVQGGDTIAVADIVAGHLTFQPDADANGNGYATFTFQVQDDGGTANGGVDLDPSANTITIDVTPVNDAPVATDDAYGGHENQTLTIAAPGVLSNDSDVEGDKLSAVLDAGPAHGTLSLGADGSFVYTPDLDYSGSDTFTYHANDGALDSETATVQITIPSLENQSLTGTAAAETILGGGGNDTLDGAGGADSLDGRGGDDTLHWNSAAAAIDGGTGTNTLLVDAGIAIDFSAPGNPTVANIEQMNLGGGNTVTLQASDVVSMTDASHTLTIFGDGTDTVNAGAGWTETINTGPTHTYTHASGATLVVDATITVITT